MKFLVHLLTLGLLLSVTACENSNSYETYTFRLQYLQSDEAMSLIMPYIDLEKGMVYDSHGRLNTITVRASEDVIQQIESVLEEYDRPPPTVQLQFQLIEANGFTESDPDIKDVESALRELFKFRGYRLVDQTVIRTSADSRLAQRLGAYYTLEGQVRAIHDYSDTIELEVHLVSQHGEGVLFATTLRIPAGQTVVLGNARVRTYSEGGALENTIILVARPELVD